MDQPDLFDLHKTAVASEDRADWMRFYQAFAGRRLIVPLADAAGVTARPALITRNGIQAVQAFPDMAAYAVSLVRPGHYAEMSGAELAEGLGGQDTPLMLLDGPEPPIVLNPGQLGWIARTFQAEVVRAEGAGVTVSTPEDLPAATLEMLGKTIEALGVDCRAAWLVSMTEPDGQAELVLALDLAESARKMEEQIAETIARTVQAVTKQPFAVACPRPDEPFLAAARKFGIGIGVSGSEALAG